MKSKSASECLKSYGGIHQELTSRGFKPKLKTLDNEASAALKSFSTKNDVEYQLVPSHCHRCNSVERAIRTFKEHFVSGLASVDPNFPLHLWDHLLPQAEMTLNLLRKSRQHPQLSATAHYHGMIDCKKLLLLHQDARSLHMKHHLNGKLGHLVANMATPWGLQCTIIGANMFASHQLPAKG
jgi:hypothetical protein